MKLIFFIVVVASWYRISEGCNTNAFCYYHQAFCDYARKYYGLRWYNYCLESLCTHCTLCGVCDGENQAHRATMSERYLCVKEHNRLRSLHEDTGPVEWDHQMSVDAQKYAEHLVNKVTLAHGASAENLFLKIGSNGTTVKSCISATQAWYNESQHYDWTTYNSTSLVEEVNHFVQVIWRSVTKIGVGVAVHKETKFVYVVVRYDAPLLANNVKQNVMPLRAP